MSKNVIQDKSFEFSLIIIKLYKKMIEEKEYVLSKQLLRSGTSIGANVVEASAAISKRDFVAKMSISSKEARETRYWLQLIKLSDLVKIDVNVELQLIEDLINILTSIVKTSQQNLK